MNMHTPASREFGSMTQTDFEPVMPLPPVGTHCIMEMYGCPAHLLNHLELIESALEDASQVARSTLLKLSAYQFEPHGVTALALLAESHISIHTWPERGYAAVDLFTCGEHTDPQAGCLSLAKALQAQSYTLAVVPRGGPAPDPVAANRTYTLETVVCP